MCGKSAGVMTNNMSARVCDDCQAGGAGWSVIFDKESGIGAIPENLIRQYGL